MQSQFKSLIWLFTVMVIAIATTVACSGGPSSPDSGTGQAAQTTDLDTPTPTDEQTVQTIDLATPSPTGEQAVQTIDLATPSPIGEQVLVGDKGFLTVGIGTNVDDVYPPGLDPSCVPPKPGYFSPGGPLPDSPPVPGYLPEGFALKEGRNSGDRHFADRYASTSNSYHFTVYVWTCSRLSIPAEAHWELVTVAGHWGILFDGACFEGSDGGCDWDPNFARTLWFETDRGYVVEMRSPVNPLDKDELIKIAESMPVFDS